MVSTNHQPTKSTEALIRRYTDQLIELAEPSNLVPSFETNRKVAAVLAERRNVIETPCAATRERLLQACEALADVNHIVSDLGQLVVDSLGLVWHNDS